MMNKYYFRKITALAIAGMMLLAVPFQALAVESTSEAETGEQAQTEEPLSEEQAQTEEPVPEEQAEPEEETSVMSEETKGNIQTAEEEREEEPQEQDPHVEEEQAGKTAPRKKTSKKQSKTDREDAAAPLITVQPQPVAAAEGERVSLHVEANRNDVTYQWQWSKDNSKWKNCKSAGYNTDTIEFKMSKTLDGRYYRCAVKGGGKTVYSEGARITLAENTLQITAQPQPVAAAEGERVSLYVEANRNDVTYQWQWSKDNSKWKNCKSAGYNTDTIEFKMSKTMDGRYYRCVVTGGGKAVYSEGAQITLAKTEVLIDNVVYAVVDGKMTVTGYRGNAASVTVQKTVDGQTVTVIGESAFENNTALTRIDLPDTIQVIGRRAFAGCSNLAKMD